MKAKSLNNFSSNIANSLKLPKSKDVNPFLDNTEQPTLKATVEKNNNSAVLAINTVHEIIDMFTFKPVTLKDAVKEIDILNGSKAIQNAYVPVKHLKHNKGFSAP